MKLTKKILTTGTLLTASLLLSTSCSVFMPDRSFIEEMNRETDPYLVAGKDFPVVSGDTGETHRSREEIKKRTPASERSRVKQKEEDLMQV